MSRKRRNATRKPSPAATQSFALPSEPHTAPDRPQPNKWFLATAILLEAGWLTLLLVLAI
ncbi:unnamed protein product, partial [marine sediment metagenome]